MPIRLDVADGIGTITIDRPPVNALDRAHQAELRKAAEEAGRRSEIRAVLICGTDAVFSAGADIREMAALTPREMKKHAPILQSAFTAVAEIPKPVCAAIEGFALGGGLELALAADIRVCAEDAELGLPEIKLGVIPGAGGTQRLARLVGPARAKLAVMTGLTITSREAEEIGLVDEVVPAGTASDAGRSLLERFTDGPAAALAAAKRAINGIPTSGFRLETDLFGALFGTADQVEGMAAFLEKREPRFGGLPASEK